IFLGTGHGLTEAQTVTYTRGAGPPLTPHAQGNDDNFAKATAGSGGLIAGAGADAQTDTASLPRGTGGHRANVHRRSRDIDAQHTATINSSVSTMLATAIGGSGATADNDVASTVEAKIGDNATVTAREFDMDAVNRTYKPDIGYNAQAGAGGVFVGTAASS